MPTYLVERYLPRTTPELLAASALRALQAAERMSAAGTPVRYLHSIYLPRDEMWFCLFEAGSAHAVAESNEVAGIPYERITEAIHLDAESLLRLDRAAMTRPSPVGEEREGGPQCQ